MEKKKVSKLNTFAQTIKKQAPMLDGLSLTVILATAFLTVFGCLMVYSATYYSSGLNGGNQYRFLVKQIVGVVVGFAGMLFFYLYPYQKLKKFKWWALLIAAVLLLLVFVPFIGVENYGAKRWIGLGVMTFQPSELAKFVLVLFAAAHLSDNYLTVKKFKTIVPVLFVGGLFCLLVILEPNMSITMCLALTLIIMLFVGGVNLKSFGALALAGGLVVPALIFMEPYRIKRLMAFLDPWSSPKGEGFQLIQSLYALGSGGWFGVGVFNSRQKHLFLPFSESDFIFSIIAEEIGFVGCILLLGVFIVLISSLIKIALKATNRFASLLVCGIATVISVQVLINIAVVTGSIPPTGLPLPFISAGGTSLMVFMSAIGVCLNVRRESNVKKE